MRASLAAAPLRRLVAGPQRNRRASPAAGPGRRGLPPAAGFAALPAGPAWSGSPEGRQARRRDPAAEKGEQRAAVPAGLRRAAGKASLSPARAGCAAGGGWSADGGEGGGGGEGRGS